MVSLIFYGGVNEVGGNKISHFYQKDFFIILWKFYIVNCSSLVFTMSGPLLDTRVFLKFHIR